MNNITLHNEVMNKITFIKVISPRGIEEITGSISIIKKIMLLGFLTQPNFILIYNNVNYIYYFINYIYYNIYYYIYYTIYYGCYIVSISPQPYNAFHPNTSH